MVPPSTEQNPRSLTVEQRLTIGELLEKPFPNVPRLGIRVGLEEKVGKYNLQLLTYLYNLADCLDTQTDGKTWLEELVPGVFRNELFSYQKVVEQQEKYIATLQRLAQEPQGDKKIVFACPVYGALSIAEQLREIFPGSVFTCNIGGSSGTTTGFAEVHGELAEDVLDKNKTVVFVDDVGDSFITAAQLAMKRRGRRLGYLKKQDYEKDMYAQQIKLIQDLREERKNLEEQKGEKGKTEESIARLDEKIEAINEKLAKEYPLLAPLFQEENVVIATLYSKNRPVFETLTSLTEEQANGERDQWIKIQKQFLTGVCTEIDEGDWVVGAQGDWLHPLLDIKVNGEEILERIQGSSYYGLLTIMGLGELSVRVGAGIKSLKIFNPEKKEDLLQTLTDLVVEWIKLYEASLG